MVETQETFERREELWALNRYSYSKLFIDKGESFTLCSNTGSFESIFKKNKTFWFEITLLVNWECFVHHILSLNVVSLLIVLFWFYKEIFYAPLHPFPTWNTAGASALL